MLGLFNDDLLLISLAFYFLGLAGVEFSIGLLLVVMFRSYGEHLNFKLHAGPEQATVLHKYF